MTQIFPLSEGAFSVGADKTFIPFNLETDDIQDRKTGSMLIEVQPFAVVNDKDVIIFDTGLGMMEENGLSQITNNLLANNIHPEDVTKILLSHLHKDHVGGLLRIIQEGTYVNAKIYIYEPEFDFAYEKGAPSYNLDILNEVRFNDQIEWINGLEGEIDGYIKFRHTGGHSPQHIAFLVYNDDSVIFYGGDEAAQSKQLKFKYIAKYDYDGRKAMELRKRWMEMGKEEKWDFLFYHDVKVPHQIFE